MGLEVLPFCALNSMACYLQANVRGSGLWRYPFAQNISDTFRCLGVASAPGESIWKKAFYTSFWRERYDLFGRQEFGSRKFQCLLVGLYG